MAIYLLPNNARIDTSQISMEDLMLYKQHKKSIYDLAVKDEKEMKRLCRQQEDETDEDGEETWCELPHYYKDEE